MTSLLIDPSTVQVHIDKKMDVFCVERTLNGFRVLKTMDGRDSRKSEIEARSSQAFLTTTVMCTNHHIVTRQISLFNMRQKRRDGK